MHRLPCSITATGADGLVVDGEVDVLDGRFGFASMTVRTEDGRHVTGERLRSIPVAQIVRTVAERIVLTMRHPSPGTVAVSPFGAPPPKTGRSVSDEQLEWLSDLYSFCRAVGEPPTQSVARAFEVSVPTATRWVARARKRKLIDDEREED